MHCGGPYLSLLNDLSFNSFFFLLFHSFISSRFVIFSPSDSVRQRWHLKTAMKNIEQCLRVMNNRTKCSTEQLHDLSRRLLFLLEPKPFRSSSASQESSSSNSFTTDDRDRSSIVLNPLPGLGSVSDFSGNNDCVLHVICSPMVIRYPTVRVTSHEKC